MPALVQIADKLRRGPVDHPFHVNQSGAAVFVGIPARKRFVFDHDADKPGPMPHQPFPR